MKSKFYLKSDFIVIWLIWDKLCQHLSSIKHHHFSLLKKKPFSVHPHSGNLSALASDQLSPVFQFFPCQENSVLQLKGAANFIVHLDNKILILFWANGKYIALHQDSSYKISQHRTHFGNSESVRDLSQTSDLLWQWHSAHNSNLLQNKRAIQITAL